jgi:chromate reductase, NAD(P)H dehydrogenase (quinone)
MEGMAMEKIVHILGFAGSLRKDSYNRALLRNAANLLPEYGKLEIFDLEGIPPFNADLEANLPHQVQEFKSKIEAADALLIVTPEYNYSIPGVLKNAIDWASRPSGDNSFHGKPVAIMSTSTGMLGGARAQYQLRQIFVFLDMHPINKPEVMISFAPQKFDNEGNLTDEKAKSLIKDLLSALITWTGKMQS